MIRRAKFVTRLSLSGIGLLLLCFGLASCVQPAPVFVGWDTAAGETTGPKSVVSLDWSGRPGLVASIDGKPVGGRCVQAELLPGRHVITYAYHTAEFGQHPQGTIELEMQAGHAYALSVKLCFWCSPRRFAVWVDDRTTGELVWGKRPDWPAWYL
jgi:hypothetical protein